MSGQPFVRLNDDCLMPQLGLGVWQASIEQTRHAVIHALKTGYRSIDTASVYQNEEGVGQALQQSDLPGKICLLPPNSGIQISYRPARHWKPACKSCNFLMWISTLSTGPVRRMTILSMPGNN
ncbi:2,5-diketo-D-gluconic acid reductase A [Tatumella ptyseos]|uniref:2,5-diketo-D-gluconic acid reductase A n=1 Tax=Tatumella ptyseos TaxID=82987 RepID=A0A2X5NGW7_9GAMM|nr:2,5-diketo-D-gluconic acid reductase A [Tatumella ptyseos]